MPKRTTDFRDDLLGDLADPEEAKHYLNAALEDSEEMFLVALQDVAEATGIVRVPVVRMPTAENNPALCGLSGILRAVGLNFAIGSEHRKGSDRSNPSPRSLAERAGAVTQIQGGQANMAREPGRVFGKSLSQNRKGMTAALTAGSYLQPSLGSSSELAR
ncbi:MAG: hypothetical protein ABIZ80_13985 [Bryobacteraceae bacterium]